MKVTSIAAPMLKPLEMDSLAPSSLYIGAAGFEDRALAVLKSLETVGGRFHHAVAVDYRPYNPRNRRSEFEEKARAICDHISWESYNRFQPEQFAEALIRIRDLSRSSSEVVVDISAMSKMLVVTILHGLRALDCSLRIVYSQAVVYHPTRSEYEARSRAPLEPPIFLTTDVFRVVTTNELSSIAMQGAPIVMIAFPNFNYLELMALLNEVNPNQLVLIEGAISSAEDKWRFDAVRELNRGIETYLEPKRFQVNPMDLASNLSLLDELYDEYCYTHKIALAPTGGKLQAVTSFVLKIMHPDLHIVYPAVRDFARDYTEGWQKPSEMRFPSFREFVGELDKHRMEKLLEMKKVMEKR